MRFDGELNKKNCKFDIYWKKTINVYSWLYWIYLRAHGARTTFLRAQTKILRAQSPLWKNLIFHDFFKLLLGDPRWYCRYVEMFLEP